MTPSKNDEAIRSYESSAEAYARQIDPHPPAEREAALRRLAAAVQPGAAVLEVGSGTGRDADFLETLGLKVRRTDATRAFLELQMQRGKRAELLNILTDDFGGPCDAVLALCVLLHVERDLTDRVLHKVAGALRPGGAFLVSVRDETGAAGDRRNLTFWDRAGFAARLEAAGLRVDWDDRHTDEDGDTWLTFLAGKTGDGPRPLDF
ncbi:class I SAM-dependent methyltransferase [Variovorax sp. ZS18.2.2]|uniref:class I SAM-dependent methyltransferase n=1 Tax=Variovorax sp. ZS18.2.2 TaxID=2971255 RepID=UPI002150BB85|nr:class I SAM-dependent methyltransferase [Variovorax sp. ZS18.2.2]MCR6475755.1 class I SAM-dependent methyltransferase [Variovorax sp. ZS18.2.2]